MPTIVVLFCDGGMGDVGKHVVNHAIKREDLTVRALASNPENLETTESVTKVKTKGEPGESRLTLIKVDAAADVDTLEEAFKGADAVVSCIGNRQIGFPRVAAPAAGNIVAAMERTKVTRLVMISSVGIGESWPPMRWTVYGTIFKWMLRLLLRSVLRDLNKAESIVKASSLDYLIVRPTGLTPEAAPKGSWKTITEPGKDTVDFQIAKEDISAYMLEEALNPTRKREAVTIGWPDQ